MKYSILNLFFQAEESIIRDSKMRNNTVNFFQYIIKTLKNAISLFYLQENYQYFDPHVGDTACQIRACLFTELAMNDKDWNVVLEKIKLLDIIEKRIILFSKNMEINDRNNKDTLKNFADKIGIDMLISETEKIIYEAYFLTIFKIETENGSSVIDFDKISRSINISRKLAKKLTRHYQLSIANYSCRKILDWSSKSSIIDPFILMNLIKKDDDDREVLPCYLYSKIIYGYALKKGINIIIQSRVENEDISILFTPDQGKNSFVNIDISEKFHTPAIVISGYSLGSKKRYRERIVFSGLRNIFLSAMAAHPQYTGKKLTAYSEDFLQDLSVSNETELLNEEFQSMKSVATLLGCSPDCPHLFVVKHIYPGAIFLQNSDAHLHSKEKTLHRVFLET